MLPRMRKLYSFVLCLLPAWLVAQPVVFDDDYGSGITFAAFGGSTNNLSVDATTARPGSAGTRSLRIDVPAGGYTGGAMVAAANANLSTYNAVTFWVRASKTATLNVAGLGNNAASNVWQVEATPTAVGTSWVKVTIPIPDPAKLTAFNGLFHFAEGSDEGAYSLWLDDIQYESVAGGTIGTPTVTMDNQTLTRAIGGTFGALNVRATYPISSVNRDFTLAGAYLTFASNPVGRITFSNTGIGTAATAGPATVTATLAGVAVAGTINVTVSGAANEPTTAAPTPPARNASDVVSLFSNAYSNVPGTDWFPNWGQSTVVTDVQVAGNDTKRYANLNYQGVQFAAPINAAGMNRLHLDIWTPDCTELKVFLINTGPVEQAFTITPTLSNWMSLDIDLASFNTINLSSIIQFKFEGVPFGSSNVYMDNIYFYNTNALPVKLTGFSARRQGQQVLLNWNTATEQNNKGFAIERSADGRSWQQVGFVAGAGNSNSARQYSHSDAATDATVYYRLKQIDFDGKSTYSQVLTVKAAGVRASVQVYPNPARGQVYVQAEQLAGTARYEVVQLGGQMVAQGTVQLGAQPARLDLSRLAPGQYLLRISVDGSSFTDRVVLQ